MEDLLLKIDLADIKSEISDTTRAYTEMGRALQGSFFQASEGITTLHYSIKAGKSSIKIKPISTKSVEGISSAAQAAKKNVGQSRDVSTSLQRLNIMNFFKGKKKGQGSATSVEDTKMEELRRQFGVSKDQSLGALESLHENSKGVPKILLGVVVLIKKQVGVVLKVIGSALSKIPGASGGFIGALIGTMVLGYKEMDRKRAEMGEMNNVFMVGVDSIMSAGTRRAVRSFSAWAERAQWQWGVGRKEVQGTIKSMIDNGITVEEMTKKFDKGLGMVGKNIVTFSIGLAKHFNYSSADSINYITTLVREYGMETHEAGRLLEQVSYAGVNSSIGVKRFTDIVMRSSEPLSRMGVNASEVGAMVSGVIAYLQSQGLKSQYAGDQADQIVTDLMSAFSNINDQFKVSLMRDINPDDKDNTDVDALLVKFKDGLARKGGANDGFIEGLVKSYYSMLSGQVEGRSEQILATTTNLGVSNRTATLLVDMGAEFASGKKLEDMSKDSRRRLRNAFNAEKKQTSRLQRVKRDLILHTAKLGSSIMAILVDLVGLLTVGSNALAVIVLAPEGTQARALERINIKMDEYTGNMSKHFTEAGGHLINVLKIAGSEVEDTFAPVIVVLRDATFSMKKSAMNKKKFKGRVKDAAVNIAALAKNQNATTSADITNTQTKKALKAAKSGGSKRSGTNQLASEQGMPSVSGVQNSPKSTPTPQGSSASNLGSSTGKVGSSSQVSASDPTNVPVKVVGLVRALDQSKRVVAEKNVPRN